MRQYLPEVAADAPPMTLAAQAYAAVRTALMIGHLRPGERLTLRGLAEDLRMSVTPVREAVQLLITEHALVMPGPKTVIVPRIDRDRYDEIILIRMALEPVAAIRALDHLTAADISLLRQINQRHREAIAADNVSAVLNENKHFHFLIYRACNLPRLIDLIENQWVCVGPTLNLLFPSYMRSFTGNQIHERVVDAIEARDPVALRAGIEADLTTAQQQLVTVLSSAA